MNNKGYSLVELILAVGVSTIILGAILLSYTGTLKVFKDVKAISDNIQMKTPSIELISRSFDRWGVGVVSREDLASCRSCQDYTTDCCPIARRSMTITTTNGCSDVTFFGNFHGFGFVKGPDPIADPANIISCRLNNSKENQNCYILWRDNFPLNNMDSNNILIPLKATDLSIDDAECLTLTAVTDIGTAPNATLSSALKARVEGNPAKVIKSGDFIQRFPHQIRLYCNANSRDGGRTWLYADMTDTTSNCGSSDEPATPIAPVNNFLVTPLPAGCDSDNGKCTAVKVDITFRSQTEKYAGSFDEYKVTKVFGR
ncbi:MAG: hypothetical protein QMD01_06285 [Thermodesulfovibrionales bacterium]|nr:hypothetical protein [Thermodesulfovibrionales bacterium]